MKSLDSLIQENEQLKADLELAQVQLNSYFVGEEKLVNENKQLKECLDDIKQYCERIINVYCKCEHFNPRYTDAEDILNIINNII